MYEKEAWLHIVKPADLDSHMANIEQAKTNAIIVKELFEKCPLVKGSRLLVHGCGTCQMFDYITPADMGAIPYICHRTRAGTGNISNNKRKKIAGNYTKICRNYYSRVGFTKRIYYVFG